MQPSIGGRATAQDTLIRRCPSRPPAACLLALGLLLAAGPAMAQAAGGRQRPARPAPPSPPALAVPAPVPVAPALPTPPPPLERRITFGELGVPPLLALGPQPREVTVPLPVGLPAPRARVLLLLEPGTAPTEAELRLSGARPGTPPLARAVLRPGQGPARLEAELPDAALAGAELRLEITTSAPAALRATGHVALLLPDGALPPLAALPRLLPQEAVVVTGPGPLPAEVAAAGLRLALALSAGGRAVRLAAEPPATAVRAGPGGERVWTTATLILAAGQTAPVAGTLGGALALALPPAAVADLATALEAPWRRVPAGAVLPLAALRPGPDDAPGSLGAQRAVLGFTVSARELPAGRRPAALDLVLQAPHGGGAAGVAVLLNGARLGVAALPAAGPARLSFAIPPALPGLDNQVTLVVDRAAPRGPVRLEPGSALRLAAAPPPREFRDLPGAFAGGVEVLLDAPPRAETLAAPLLALRALAPPGTPLRVTLPAGDAAPRPAGPYLAATRRPPDGVAPPLPPGPGRLRLEDREGAVLALLGPGAGGWLAQLPAGGPPGLWLRPADPDASPPPPLPATPPRLDRGDVALLDGGGVALAWRAGPAAAVVARPADPAAGGAWWQAARPWAVGAAWLAGAALVLVLTLGRRSRGRGAIPTPAEA